jgi:hypothetical protein
MAQRRTYIPSMLHTAKISLLAALGLAAVSLPAPAWAGGAPVVVELYTSQGCSSCPTADDALSRMAGRDDVVALALHIDYWDYLGWRDTFGQREFAERQAGYRDAWRKNVLYTPQIIVQGRHDVSGLEPAQLDAAIAEAQASEPAVRLSLQREGGMLKCRIEPGAERASGTVWIAKYTRSATVTIERGENAGRTITYANVVSSLDRIGTWAGSAAEEVAMPQPGPGEGVAIWVQDGAAGPIMAAAKVENPE